MSTLKNKLSRARRLPPGLIAAEAGWRVARVGLGLAGSLRDQQRRRSDTSRPTAAVPFLIDPAGDDTPDPTWVQAAVAEAEEALSGRFRVLGYGALAFGTPPAWLTDVLRQHTWPLAPHREITTPTGVADIKVPWEASRFHWLVALARAYAYTGQDAYRAGAHQLLTGWAQANPTGFGPNWANAMEAGIRCVNLVLAAEILADSAFSTLAGELLRDHAEYILANPEYAPSLTSNHFLADVVGVIYAAAALPATPANRALLKAAGHTLAREIRKQFHPDGSNFEASTGYHRLSTELALLGLLALRKAGQPAPEHAEERTVLAVDALTVLQDPSGRLFPLGDDDSGLVAGLQSGRHPLDPAPLVETATYAFGLAPGTRPSSEMAWWLAGRGRRPEQTAGAAPLSAYRTSTRSTALPCAGWYVLQSDELWCLIDAGGVGQSGNGGHAHNDTLSFVLAAAGHQVVVDPGTCEYTGDPAVRNACRSTSAHATVQIDGQEINRFNASDLFQMQDDDRPTVDAFTATDDGGSLLARHHGYERLPDPVVHQRTFELTGSVLRITDRVACAGQHDVTCRWPIGPGLTVALEDDSAEGSRLARVSGENFTVEWRQLDGPRLKVTTEPAIACRAYGAPSPITVIRGDRRISGATTFTVELRFTTDETRETH